HRLIRVEQDLEPPVVEEQPDDEADRDRDDRDEHPVAKLAQMLDEGHAAVGRLIGGVLRPPPDDGHSAVRYCSAVTTSRCASAAVGRPPSRADRGRSAAARPRWWT